jgi:hypothetical protein
MTDAEMIHAGEVGPGAALLISDSGAFVLRSGGHSTELDADALIAAITRAGPLAALVARSATPISGMSGPVERMLARFGCERVAGTPPAGEGDQ